MVGGVFNDWSIGIIGGDIGFFLVLSLSVGKS